MAQAQLFGKGNKLHLGFVLVGFPCCLIELPGVGAQSLHRQETPNPSWCVAIPSLATSALQRQLKAQLAGAHLASQLWREDSIIFCVQDEEGAAQHLHAAGSKHSPEDSPQTPRSLPNPCKNSHSTLTPSQPCPSCPPG